MYQQMENLLLKSVCSENVDQEFEAVTSFYGDDLRRSSTVENPIVSFAWRVIIILLQFKGCYPIPKKLFCCRIGGVVTGGQAC